MCDQLFIRRHIGSKIARIQKRRRTDPHMYFLCAGFFQHFDNICAGCPTHDGIIHHNDPLSAHHFFNYIQLDLNAGFSLTLLRFNERSAHIAVFMECHSVGNSRLFGIPLCSNKSRIRNTYHKIRLNRIRFSQRFPGNDTGMVNVDIIDRAVHSCKIDVFKNTSRLFLRCDRHTLIRSNSIFRKAHDFSRLYIAHKLCPHSSQCTAF